MALIQPNSRIDFLTGIPFDPSYENTMYFDDLNSQVAYFDTKIARTAEQYSYVRVSEGYIKVGWVVDNVGMSVINQMYNVNYMRFKNTNFENKWFYAFVDRVEYINNNTVGVYYHLDVIQTWHFEYSFNQCMIERQHTTTDAIGGNTIPEDLELGDYVFGLADEFDYTPYAFVVTAGDTSGNYQGGSVVSGLISRGNWFSGVHFYGYNLTDATTVSALNTMLETAYTDRNKQNTIIAVFVYSAYFMQGNKVPIEVTMYLSQIDNNYRIGNHIVRNKKLMTYPYNMIYVTNYQGSHAEYHYEYFSNPAACKLKIWGSAGVNPGMILYPYNYKTSGDNFDEMIQLTGFPMCAWVNDAYKAWVAQNAGTINAGIASVGAMWADTAYKGIKNAEYTGKHSGVGGKHIAKSDYDVSGSLRNSLMATAALIGQIRDHAVMPPTAHGNANGDVQFQSGRMTFMYCNKHIREEYAEIIDDFFDMYGYAIHKYGIPNRNARPCYTYVKTVDCSLDGNVPVEDLRLIEEIFNKGIRFWKTSATFGVYDVLVNNNRV